MTSLASLRVLTAALLVSGCSSIPLTSLPRLSRIDARTTDLSVLRVALRLPEAIRPKSQGVALDVVTKVSGEADQKTTFTLTETRDASDLDGLPPSGGGASTYAFALSPADRERLAALRADGYAKKELGKRVSLGMDVAAKEFCRAASLSSAPLLATTYLRTSETDGYVVVTKDVDLMQDSAVAAQMASLEPC